MKNAVYKIGAVISTSIVCFFVWLALTWSVTTTELVTGAVVSLVVGLFTSRFFIHSSPAHLWNPVRLARLLWYSVAVFTPELVKANISMALKCFGPLKNVNPGIVKVETKLKSEYGLAMLSNAITLTPGTITMDVVGEGDRNYLYIHWIDDDGSDREKAGETIKGRLERSIGGIWK